MTTQNKRTQSRRGSVSVALLGVGLCGTLLLTIEPGCPGLAGNTPSDGAWMTEPRQQGLSGNGSPGEFVEDRYSNNPEGFEEKTETFMVDQCSECDSRFVNEQQNDSLYTPMYRFRSIGPDKCMLNSFGSRHIQNYSLQSWDFADKSVGARMLKGDSVTAGHIAATNGATGRVLTHQGDHLEWTDVTGSCNWSQNINGLYYTAGNVAIGDDTTGGYKLRVMNASGTAIYGLSEANNYVGVRGRSDAETGTGVEAYAYSSSGVNYGLYAETNSPSGYAGYFEGGRNYFEGKVGVGTDVPVNKFDVAGGMAIGSGYAGAQSAPTDGLAVEGQVKIGSDTASTQDILTVEMSASGRAIYAKNYSSNGVGIQGRAYGSTGVGIEAYGIASTGVNYGVYGETNSPDGIAGYFDAISGGVSGYFDENVVVEGTITKGGGSFRIDHPLDPENKYLYHSFVESPDMMNIYNGNVTLDEDGVAVVVVPEWFEPLNRDFRYQLTAIGAPGPHLHIAEEIADSQFIIAGGQPGMKVSWQVTGIRQDAFAEANRIPVEEWKAQKERGLFLHPEAFGEPEARGISHVLHQREVNRD